MAIQADEAANALKDAAAAAERSLAAQGYQTASGYLIIWGVIWTAANLACQASLHLGQIAWSVGAAAGAIASFILSARQPARRATGGRVRALLIVAAFLSFGIADALIAPRLTFQQSDAVAALLVGAVYVAMGSSVGLRLSAVGAAVMAATVAGWYVAHDYFFLWMAAAGGGGLIVGGLWFRKA